MLNPLSLYIHVPFCSRRCDYCHFYVVTGLEKLIPEYVSALQHEIKLIATDTNSFEITTIYFGGGTPSLLSGDQVKKILTTCRTNLKLSSDCEISLEANPESLTLSNLENYLAAGINRLSLGLQAAQDTQLKSLGRTYTVAEFKAAAKLVRQAGFKNFNLDLIFGLPNQTLTDWEDSLSVALTQQPNHLSCYSLELDHQSVFGQKYRRGTLHPANDELNRQFYQLTKVKLASAGYKHYEISNWAKPGFECQHNLKFWQNQPYLGIGAGAHSYFSHQTWQNQPIVKSYLETIQADQLPRKDAKAISSHDAQAESVILNLRILAGINLAEFETRHSFNPLKLWPKLWPELIDQNFIRQTPGNLTLTDLGQDFYDQVATQIWQATLAI